MRLALLLLLYELIHTIQSASQSVRLGDGTLAHVTLPNAHYHLKQLFVTPTISAKLRLVLQYKIIQVELGISTCICSHISKRDLTPSDFFKLHFLFVFFLHEDGGVGH